MISRLIEVDNGGNWGKMLVAQFDQSEMNTISALSGTPLLESVEQNIRTDRQDPRARRLILDLQTREGVLLTPSPEKDPKDDLDAHSIWVCPLYYPFLKWLYQQDISDVSKLSNHVRLPYGDLVLQGYRRSGPDMTPVAKIREHLVLQLGKSIYAPVTLTEVHEFMVYETGESWALLRTFLSTLSPTEKTRWIGAMMADSGRYISAMAPNKVALIPKPR